MSAQQHGLSQEATCPVRPTILKLAHTLRNPSSLLLKGEDAVGIANGLSGIVLLPLTLVALYPSQEWLSVALSYFKRLAQETYTKPLAHPGLYHGTSGVVFALSLLAEQDQRYGDHCQTVLAQLLKQIAAWNWQEQPLLSGQHNFELIGGASGILRVLLLHAQEANVQSVIERLLTYLVWVSERSQRWQHHQDMLGPIAKARYPEGYTDLGLAHGIAGPPAVLSLAQLQGCMVPGMNEAIERWAVWLVHHQLSLPWGRDWPSVLPTQCHLPDCPPARAAWCYGAPGIARALSLVGRALEEAEIRAIAREALAATLRRPAQQRNIEEPHICHGLAGLLLVCLRFLHDDAQACSPWLQEAVPLLTTHLLTVWNERWAQMEPGFLTGSIGGALTLIAALTTQEAAWDRALLLS